MADDISRAMMQMLFHDQINPLDSKVMKNKVMTYRKRYFFLSAQVITAL